MVAPEPWTGSNRRCFNGLAASAAREAAKTSNGPSHEESRSNCASFSPNTSYLQYKSFEESLPTTPKLRTTTKFLSGPVGCQDFDESSRSTGAPFNIHNQQTPHSLFFCYFPSHTSSVRENALNGACLLVDFCFSIGMLKHSDIFDRSALCNFVG